MSSVFERRLTAEGLKAHFLDQHSVQWQAEPLEERFFLDREPAAAAVLIPLVKRPDGLHVLLTMRTAHLNDHAGQIAFPGGRCEESDADEIATALRETEEETGLHRRHVEIVGQMPVYQTATNFLVTPVVGLVEPQFELNPDSFEVEEVFEVPFAFLMNEANHQTRTLQTPKGPRTFYAMPYDCPQREKQYFIWGATAAMIRNLYHFMRAGV